MPPHAPIDTHIHTLKVAAAMQATVHPVGTNRGCSVLPKDTTTDKEGVEFEKLTLQLSGNRLTPPELWKAVKTSRVKLKV